MAQQSLNHSIPCRGVQPDQAYAVNVRLIQNQAHLVFVTKQLQQAVQGDALSRCMHASHGQGQGVACCSRRGHGHKDRELQPAGVVGQDKALMSCCLIRACSCLSWLHDTCCETAHSDNLSLQAFSHTCTLIP